MRNTDLGEVIAVRSLEMEANGIISELLVSIGKPRPMDDAKDFIVPYRIEGGDVARAFYMAGVDAFQALQLTMRALGVELEVLNQEPGRTIRWECGEEGEFGFPKSEV